MFGKGKKTVPGTMEDAPAVDSVVPAELNDQIHTMPERFYFAPKKRRSGLAVLVIFGVAVLAGLIGYGVYLKGNLAAVRTSPPQTPPAPPVAVTNQNTNVTPPPPANVNRPAANQNTPLNLNLANVNQNANANQNVNQNLNINQNTTTTTSSAVLPQAPDVDGDGFTQAEEILYGTDSNLSDTDGDSYGDGLELLNGYDPTRARLTVTETGLLSTYQHSRFTLLYPKSWTVTPSNKSATEVFFRSAGGEFVEVILLDKPAGQTLEQWFIAQFPGQDLTTTTSVQFSGGLAGLRTQDLQTYYLSTSPESQTVFAITYNAGNLQQLNFLTTFMAMAKFFRAVGP